MSTHGTKYHQFGNWLISVDRWDGFPTNSIVVQICQSFPRETHVYGPNGNTQVVLEGDELSADMVWHIPADGATALAHALLEVEPADERLVATLERLLEREAARVDKFVGLESETRSAR